MPAALARVLVVLLPLLLLVIPPDRIARADEVLLTVGDMMRLRELPLESDRRRLSDEDLRLYRSYEFYAYTAFEALQVANSAAELIGQEPLFCAPEDTFRFHREGDIVRLAEHVTDQLFRPGTATGGSLDRYAEEPVSLVLLLGLRAAFPCASDEATIAQR